MVFFKQTRIAVVLVSLVSMASAAPAHDVTIGGVAITIPEPAGFVAVTPEMSAFFEYQKQFVAPSNEEFVTFISEADAEIARRGEIPDPTRKFSVQILKSLIPVSVSRVDFVAAKTALKSNNETVRKQIERDSPVADAVPFPPHLETDRLLAFSMLLKYNVDNQSGEPASVTVANTTTLVHVRAKVLYLYCFAEADDLEWTREISKSWAESVIADNPSDLGTLVQETLPPAFSRIDWGYVCGVSVGGAIIGAIIGASVWLKRRLRPRSPRSTASPPEGR